MLNALTRRSFHFDDLDPKALQSEIFLFRIRALSGGCRKAVVEDLHCCYACHSNQPTHPELTRLMKKEEEEKRRRKIAATLATRQLTPELTRLM